MMLKTLISNFLDSEDTLNSTSARQQLGIETKMELSRLEKFATCPMRERLDVYRD